MGNHQKPPFYKGWLNWIKEQQTESPDNMTSSSNEADPSGLSPHAPGAKLDAGKNRVWLMLEGFAPALSLLMGDFTSHPGKRVVVATDAVARWPWALEAVAEVTTAGAKKYTPGGWIEVENGFERYMDAYGRHGLDRAKGKIYDDGPNGTGCLHYAQQAWNLLAALTLTLTDPAIERDEAWADQTAAISYVAADLISDLDDLLQAEALEGDCALCGADENYTIQ